MSASRACKGVTANAIDVVVETGDAGPVTPIGINLPERSAHPRAVRQQVGLALERQRGLREVDAARLPRASSPGRRTRPSAPSGGARSPASCTTDMHEVIGHGSGRVEERLRREAARRPQGALLGARRGARRSGGPLLLRRSEARRAGPGAGRRATPTSCWPSTRRTPATPWCSCAASARAAQIEEDHMRNRQMIVALADRQHAGHRRAAARRQDLLRDGRRRGVPRGRRPAARRGAAHQVRRATTHAARALFDTYGVHFDPRCATRSSRASIRSTCRRTPASSCRASSRSATTRARSPTSRSRTRWTSRRRCSSIRERQRAPGSGFRHSAGTGEPGAGHDWYLMAGSRLPALSQVHGVRGSSQMRTTVLGAAVATAVFLAAGAAGGQGRSPQPGVTRLAIIQAEDARAATPDQLQWLTTAATTPSPLQAMAVRALGRLERLDQVSTLLPLLDAKQPRVRAEAASALAQSAGADPAAAQTPAGGIDGAPRRGARRRRDGSDCRISRPAADRLPGRRGRDREGAVRHRDALPARVARRQARCRRAHRRPHGDLGQGGRGADAGARSAPCAASSRSRGRAPARSRACCPTRSTR